MPLWLLLLAFLPAIATAWWLDARRRSRDDDAK